MVAQEGTSLTGVIHGMEEIVQSLVEQPVIPFWLIVTSSSWILSYMLPVS